MPADADPIDQLLALDFGGRGIATFFIPRGALLAAKALVGARRVLIATGFTVAPGAPETDGPPGATVLGRALRRLGARVTCVTDPQNAPVVERLLTTLGEPLDIEIYPEGDGAALAMLAREQPTHLVAVERPGRTRSGAYMNLHGDVITAWNPPVDELFVVSGPGSRWRRFASNVRAGTGPGTAPGSAAPHVDRERSHGSLPASSLAPPVTVGVGDGGNEVGMGNVRRRLLRAGGVIARTASVVRVDHLVVAGTSNWGAYGIVAALARLTGEDLLHAPATERRLIEACVATGAVDGVTKRAEATVDALDVDTHAAIVGLLALAGDPRRSG